MNSSPNCTNSETRFAAPLGCFTGADLAQVGGKAANLGELIRAGFPVPDGFVVTTAGYDCFTAHNGLGEVVNRAAVGPGSGAAARAAFEAGEIPSEVEGDILEAYRRLGSAPVAVRSSATAEDLPGAAFAGQQDTYLNILGEQNLLAAVRSCWASLWTDRAIAYRQRQGVDQETVKLAVVVQRMAAAEYAGVMFTANPVTGEREEIVIDSSPGLGEAVVSGRVTPDHFTLKKRRLGWSLTGRRMGRREVLVRALPGGGTEQVEGPAAAHAAAEAPALPDRALYSLARLGVKIQRHFGNPQDIEWAWTGSELLVLQSRPITALPDPPPHPSKLVQMLSALFAEMFAVRPYPLDMTTWVPAISKAAVEPVFALIGISAPSIPQFFSEQDGVAVRFSGRLRVRPTPTILLAPARWVWLSLRYNPVHWRSDPLLAEAQDRARALAAVDVKELAWQELLQIIRDALALARPLAGEIRGRYFPRVVLSAGLLRVMLGLLGHGGRLGVLLSGAESTTLEANRALERLASRIRSEPALAEVFANHTAGEIRVELERRPAGRAFLAELEDFFERFGHREVVFSTMLQPTWKDAPEVVLGLLKGLALEAPRPERGRPVWELARDEVLSHPLLRLAPFRSAFLGLLAAARCLWQIRENTHFEATRILPILRRTVLELGRRLAAVGVLDAPAEVFQLQFRELERVGGAWPPPTALAAELQDAARRRKELRVALEDTPMVDPQLYRQLDEPGEALLTGTAGSPGIAEGPVRVIHDSAGFGDLRNGEVLVAPYTNPAWTPLFQRAAAVVVDGGAAGSHAAIVAREYGIPAVMGTVTGTQKLHDGEWVRVDGSRGLVLPAQDPLPETGGSAQEEQR